MRQHGDGVPYFRVGRLGGLYLVEPEWSIHRLWLYEQGRIEAISAAWVDFFCKGPAGNKRAAACTLVRLQTLKESLLATSNVDARLQEDNILRRDRGSWLMIRFQRDGAAWMIYVHDDLAPWILPYYVSVVKQQGRPPAGAGVEVVSVGPLVAILGGGGPGAGQGGGPPAPGLPSGLSRR